MGQSIIDEEEAADIVAGLASADHEDVARRNVEQDLGVVTSSPEAEARLVLAKKRAETKLFVPVEQQVSDVHGVVARRETGVHSMARD